LTATPAWNVVHVRGTAHLLPSQCSREWVAPLPSFAEKRTVMVVVAINPANRRVVDDSWSLNEAVRAPTAASSIRHATAPASRLTSSTLAAES